LAVYDGRIAKHKHPLVQIIFYVF